MLGWVAIALAVLWVAALLWLARDSLGAMTPLALAQFGAALAFQKVSSGYRPPQWPGQDLPQQLHIDFDVPDLDEGERQVLAIGIDVGTALELTQAGGSVVGSRAVAVRDGRAASFATGSNGALGARYVIFDSFVQGDALVP